MSIEIAAEVEPEYLRLNASGQYALDELYPFIDRIKAEAAKTGMKKVLVDCRNLEGNISEADRFQAGQRIAEVFGSRLITAVVMADGQVTKLGEMAAVNRGAVILITESFTEAEEWLLAA